MRNEQQTGYELDKPSLIYTNKPVKLLAIISIFSEECVNFAFTDVSFAIIELCTLVNIKINTPRQFYIIVTYISKFKSV